MSAWESQIRTQLEDELYTSLLDRMLQRVSAARAVGLVNLRFREACLRLPGAVDAGAAEKQSIIELTSGLFGAGDDRGEAFAAAMENARPAELVYLGGQKESILMCRLTGEAAVLLLTVAANLNQGTSMNILKSSRELIGGAGEKRLAKLAGTDEVRSGALIDTQAGRVLETFEAYQGASQLSLDERVLPAIRTLFTAGAPGALRFHDRQGEPIEIRRAEIGTPAGNLHWSRIPFDPEHLLVMQTAPTALRGLVWSVMKTNEIETVRLWVDGLLAYGIKSTMSPFPKNNEEFLKIVSELRELPENDLLGRLDISGFANHEVGEGAGRQRCQECIYYLPRSRWCDLPELPIPVEAHWWCRLWKV